MTQEQLLAYIGCALALLVAGEFAFKGKWAPAAVIVALAAFLIYWTRQNRGRGER